MKTNRTARLMEKFVLPADAGSPVASAFLRCVFRRERQLGRNLCRGFGLRGRFACSFLLSCILALPGCGDTGSRGSVILDDFLSSRASLVDSEAKPSVVAEGPSLSVPSPPGFRAGTFGQPRKWFGRYCSIYRDGKTGRPFRAVFRVIPPR